MKTTAPWQYDETKHCGVDYSNAAQVAIYEQRHQRFRNFQEESLLRMQLIGLKPEHELIDLGCGTGFFSIIAAKNCQKVFAVDVSRAMLDYASNKAKDARLSNIEFCHGGFLTYEHKGKAADAIVSVAVLHHLPDFWKQVALRRIASMLKKDGKFLLEDVVFSFDVDDHSAKFDKWIACGMKRCGSDFVNEFLIHIRDEYSTSDWIMEGMLEKAGFNITAKEYKDEFFVTYLCSKRL